MAAKKPIYKFDSPELQEAYEKARNDPTLKKEIQMMERYVADLEAQRDIATGKELIKVNKQIAKMAKILAGLRRTQAQIDTRIAKEKGGS